MRVNFDQPTIFPRRSVYDGQERIGDVQQRDDGYLARGRQGVELGVFATLNEAANQCWRVAHGQTEACHGRQ